MSLNVGNSCRGMPLLYWGARAVMELAGAARCISTSYGSKLSHSPGFFPALHRVVDQRGKIR